MLSWILIKNSVYAFMCHYGRCKNLSVWSSPKWPANCPNATGRGPDVVGAARFSNGCSKRLSRFRRMKQRLLLSLGRPAQLTTGSLLSPMISRKKPSISLIRRNMRGCESSTSGKAKARLLHKIWQSPGLACLREAVDSSPNGYSLGKFWTILPASRGMIFSCG